MIQRGDSAAASGRARAAGGLKRRPARALSGPSSRGRPSGRRLRSRAPSRLNHRWAASGATDDTQYRMRHADPSMPVTRHRGSVTVTRTRAVTSAWAARAARLRPPPGRTARSRRPGPGPAAASLSVVVAVAAGEVAAASEAADSEQASTAARIMMAAALAGARCSSLLFQVDLSCGVVVHTCRHRRSLQGVLCPHWHWHFVLDSEGKGTPSISRNQ